MKSKAPIVLQKNGSYLVEKLEITQSIHLKRAVTVDVFLPPDYSETTHKYPVLLLNDGQDSKAVGLISTLDRLVNSHQIQPIIVIGVYASIERLQEYGVATQPDYKNRGAKAGKYTQFLMEELLPFLSMRYRLRLKESGNAIAGYSLGGLSAFDIGWNNTEIFSKIGVFSGALWWRSKAYEAGYADSDRIIHNQIKKSEYRPGLQFWFEVGTNDETDDRNQNGVIDAIDDTLDLITELVLKGYRAFHDIHYIEIEGGEHNPATWGKAMPLFLLWAFRKGKDE